MYISINCHLDVVIQSGLMCSAMSSPCIQIKFSFYWIQNDGRMILQSLEVCYKVITSHKSTDTRALVCFIPDYFHSTPNCVHLSWSFEAGFAPGITDGEIIHTRPPAFSHSVALLLMESYYQVLRA